MSLDLHAALMVALRATPGHWKVDREAHGGMCIADVGNAVEVCVDQAVLSEEFERDPEADAAHIAAWSPENAIAAIGEITRLTVVEDELGEALLWFARWARDNGHADELTAAGAPDLLAAWLRPHPTLFEVA